MSNLRNYNIEVLEILVTNKVILSKLLTRMISVLQI